MCEDAANHLWEVRLLPSSAGLSRTEQWWYISEDMGGEAMGPYGDIGWAVEQMRLGQKVRRTGWNGKGMFLFLVNGSMFQVNRPPLLGIYPAGTTINYQSHVDMKTASGEIVPWLCSQSDLLATDWELAE